MRGNIAGGTGGTGSGNAGAGTDNANGGPSGGASGSVYGTPTGIPAPGGSSGGASGGGGGAASTGQSSPGGKNEKTQPIAARRGANWGLPNYNQKATGITRPIRVRIEPNEILLLPERGSRGATQIIPIDGSMASATEELAARIDREVQGWGMAVANGYWKPVLNVETAPGAERRAEQLQTLLDGSGLEVRRK
jgi:hypothetical protein